MHKTYAIIQVCNAFDRRLPVTYFSTVIRMGTAARYNHIAILEYVDGEPHRVIEAAWEGVIETPWEKWVIKTDREIVIKPVLAELQPENVALVLGMVGNVSYGTADILQLGKYIVLHYWLASDYEWDGQRGTGNFKGVFCSELGALFLGDEKPWLKFPRDFDNHPALGAGVKLRTYRGVPLATLQAAAA